MKAIATALAMLAVLVSFVSDHMGSQDGYRYSQQASNLEAKSNAIRFT